MRLNLPRPLRLRPTSPRSPPTFPPSPTAVAAIHAIDWRAVGLDFLGVPSSPAEGFKGEVEAVARRMSAFGCADEPLLNRALTALLASTLSGGRLALCHGDPNPPAVGRGS